MHCYAVVLSSGASGAGDKLGEVAPVAIMAPVQSTPKQRGDPWTCATAGPGAMAHSGLCLCAVSSPDLSRMIGTGYTCRRLLDRQQDLQAIGTWDGAAFPVGARCGGHTVLWCCLSGQSWELQRGLLSHSAFPMGVFVLCSQDRLQRFKCDPACTLCWLLQSPCWWDCLPPHTWESALRPSEPEAVPRTPLQHARQGLVFL